MRRLPPEHKIRFFEITLHGRRMRCMRAFIHGVDLLLVLLFDHPSFELETWSHLPFIYGEIVGNQRELLEFLKLGEVLIGICHNLLVCFDHAWISYQAFTLSA